MRETIVSILLIGGLVTSVPWTVYLVWAAARDRWSTGIFAATTSVILTIGALCYAGLAALHLDHIDPGPDFTFWLIVIPGFCLSFPQTLFGVLLLAGYFREP